ncbi:MAG: sulfatase-like hydrolase/transferase, partial [Bacteroidales bacterium]|nr:sulfatase-like hydrolase/transferase [Bacteroidales bacterium]
MVWRFFKHYILFFLFCVVQKVVFWLYYYKEFYNECGFSDFADVVLHGLPLDAAIAGYLTAIPALLLIASVWWRSKALNYIFRGYYIFCAVLFSAVFVTDLALYEHWGFRLDTTPFFYLISSPKDAFASATPIMLVWAVVDYTVYVGAFLWLSRKFLLQKNYSKPVFNKVWKTVALTLLAAALFLPIRGGFTVATLNTGKVYFSQDMKLNHAAINPCFSLLESLSRNASFATQYRYMPPQQADEIFAALQDVSFQGNAVSLPDSVSSGRKQLLKPGKPNVVMIILESFLSKAMGTLGGIEGVAVNLDSLGANGVLFTNFYANSFRTDRGIVSILSGYPAQPTNSIMKYPRKSQSLPSISGALARNGYNLQYVYGGDANF